MIDPDAVAGPFVHWALAGLDSRARGLAPAARVRGAVLGRNGFGSIGYRGPCPPPGSRPHRYVIELYALPARLALAPGFDVIQVTERLRSVALARATLEARYSRAGG